MSGSALGSPQDLPLSLIQFYIGLKPITDERRNKKLSSTNIAKTIVHDKFLVS